MNRFEDIKKRILEAEGDWQILAIEFGGDYWTEIPWLVEYLEKAINLTELVSSDHWDSRIRDKAKEFLEELENSKPVLHE